MTKAGQSAYFAPSLLQQDFSARHINEKRVTDTTYIPTHEDWLYLVSVMDLFNCQVVGWAMGEQRDADLATSALDMAIRRAWPLAGLIVHSDRGSEFANKTFHKRANDSHIQLSIKHRQLLRQRGCEELFCDSETGGDPREHIRFTAGSTHRIIRLHRSHL